MAEKVKISVTLWARPQLIAPHGRWSYSVIGRDFELDPDFAPSYSPRGATAAARRMCKRMGWEVTDIDIETP